MKQGKRMETKTPKSKNRNQEMNKKKKRIIYTFLTIVALFIVFAIAMVLNNFIILDKNETTNLVINNNNITSNLKNEIKIEDGIIYLSKEDIANFFDPYIYEEPSENLIITTYDKKCATIGFEENQITINGSNKQIYAHAIEENGIVYLPVSEMKDVYDVEISYIEDTKVITMDSLDREQKKAIVSSNEAVKSSTNFIAKTVDRVEKGETVVIVSTNGKYTQVRTDDGKIRLYKN